MVVAPAGYGKTTLLLDFAHHSGSTVCWYTLDQIDRDARVFLEYLVATLRQKFPSFGAHTLAALQEYRPYREDSARIIGILVNEMYETIADDCVVVLDNFEAVDDSSEIALLLEALLRYLPDHIRIILASRTFPQRSSVTLPLIATGDLAGVSGHQLKFNPDEVIRLASTIYNQVITEDTANEIVERCEGWIMGIQLTSNALWRGQLEGLLSPQAEQNVLYDYVVDQIVKPLHTSSQDFLLRTGILSPLTVELANAALQIDDSESMFKSLAEDLPMLVVPLDHEGTFRYHSLFNDCLRQFLNSQPGLKREAHLQAAVAQASRDSLVEATRHYLAAGEMTAAGEIASRAVDELYQTGRWETLRLLVAELPPAARTPELLIAEALRLREQGQLEQALLVLSEVEGMGQPHWQNVAQLRRASIWSQQGRHRAALDLYQAVLDRLNPNDLLQLGDAHRGLGRIYQALRQIPSAIDHLQKSLGYFETIQSLPNIGHLHHELGFAYDTLGQLDKAQEEYQKGLTQWEALRATGWRLNTQHNLTSLMYKQGKLEEALKLAENTLSDAHNYGFALVEAAARLAFGTMLRDLGEFSNALNALHDSRALAEQIEYPYLIIYALDAIGNTLRLQGYLDDALTQLNHGLALAEKHQLPFETALCTLSLGILALDRGKEDQAQKYLETSQSALAKLNARQEQAIAEFNLARLAYIRRQHTDAIAYLNEVVDITKSLGYDYFLVKATEQAWPVVRWAMAHTPHSGFWELIYRRFQLTIGASEERPALELRTFGKTHIRLHGVEAMADWTNLRELFFFLLAHHPNGAHREQILAVFWPDTDTTRALQSLKVALHRIRRSICETKHNAGWYSLVLPDSYTYDAGEFERLAGRVNLTSISDQQAANYRQAVEFYQGEYLSEYYSDWVIERRERLKLLYLNLLMALGNYHERRGEPVMALDYYKKSLAEDEYQETTHQAMMRCYMALGDRHRAIQHFREMAQVLKQDLGIDPATETQRLYKQIIEDAS